MSDPTVTARLAVRQQRRAERYDARYTLWRVSQLKRVAFCGRFASGRGDLVSVKVSADGHAGFGGVQTCGSVWSCPVCSEKINAQRHTEVTEALQRWRDMGGHVEFMTLTVQHDRSMRLADLWDALAPSFNRATSGAGAAWHGRVKVRGSGIKEGGDRAEFGIEGMLRLVEVTHGENGWHPHLHVLVFTTKKWKTFERDAFRARMFKRWAAALTARGLKVLERDSLGHNVGVDVRPVTDDRYITEYFTKHGYRPQATSASGAAFEVTGSHAKKAGAGMTPFEILAGVCAADRIDQETGEMRGGKMAALWWEWEQASQNRRQLTWSHGFRDRLQLEQEKSDEEVAEEDHGGDSVAYLTAEQYAQVARTRLIVPVLEHAEADPTGEVLARFLGRHGIHDVRARQRKRGPSLFGDDPLG